MNVGGMNHWNIPQQNFIPFGVHNQQQQLPCNNNNGQLIYSQMPNPGQQNMKVEKTIDYSLWRINRHTARREEVDLCQFKDIPGHASFLASLSTSLNGKKRHPKAEEFFTADFRAKRDKLAWILFNYFNKTVFNNQLPVDTNISFHSQLWNKCGMTLTFRHPVTKCYDVILSKRHMENPEKVRNTLLHELCHVANLTIDFISLINIPDPHGPIWKKWTQHAESVHPDISKVEIGVTSKTITDFLYECTNCGFDIGANIPLLENKPLKCACGGNYHQVHLYDQELINTLPYLHWVSTNVPNL